MSKNLTLIKNGLLLTMNPAGDVFRGDLLVEKGRIREIGAVIDSGAAEIFQAADCIVMPGLIQTHTHLCQTIFRNSADDLPLLDWLKLKIWPLEAGHTPESLRISAQLGLAELLTGGTTTILDMGTVHGTEIIFEELERSGIRAFCGKAMMDVGEVNDPLCEETDRAIQSSLDLYDAWHGAADGRIRYAFAPRFIPSCSLNLLRQTATLAREKGTLLHSHSSETRSEVELVLQSHHKRNLRVWEETGAAGAALCLAHCIWLDEEEISILRQSGTKVLHCPGSNLKLGSGLAPVPDYIDRGITVSLGSDGAACNNNLDIFNEMRLAALIHKPRYGPAALPAEQVLRMATLEGAKTLGLDTEIGSLEKGKCADLVLLKINRLSTIPFENIYSKIVYSTNTGSVRDVMINGRWIVRDHTLLTYDEKTICDKVNRNRCITNPS